MFSIGVDAHKTVHVAVAIDDAGRTVAEWSGDNTVVSWGRFVSWLKSLEGEFLLGVEGANSYGYGLTRSVLAAGIPVYEVNSRLTALERRHARKRGKSDQLDASAVAQTVRREGAALPAVVHDEEAAMLELLCEEREDLVGECTRTRNRLHAALLRVDPEYKRELPCLTSKAALERLQSYSHSAAATGLRLEQEATVRRLARRLAGLVAEVAELTRRVETLAGERYQPLQEISGISKLTAGTLAGILGTHSPFRSDAQLAAYAGVSPLPASSAGNGKHRLSRAGNRRLNAIIYRIAIVQLRHESAGRRYVAGRLATGHGKRDAIRALKRYIVRAIWRQWLRCITPLTPQTSSACL